MYLVFFDWDKYNITPQGMQILEAAAAHFKAGGAVQIQVTGYTDLSGPAGYNQRLSERRANAVAVALEHMGVPRNDMLVSGRGMNDPRVPTALGVREPQNRRVEIIVPVKLALDRKNPGPHREVPGGRRSHLRRLSFAGGANGAENPSRWISVLSG